jgi:adenylate kinase
MSPPLQLLIMGPPGAGKGTQAKLLVERFGLAHLSTGDILRSEVRQGSALGKKAKGYMDAGDLVPDALMNEMIGEHIQRSRPTGFLLDGYPRTIPQAEAIDEYLASHQIVLDGVLNVRVEDDLLVDRIVNRASCACGEVYNLKTRPPRKPGRCDVCGAKLQVRADDDVETLKNRLRAYREKTEPVVGYYRSRGVLRDVSGEGAIDAVHAALVEEIRSLEAG